MNIQKIVEELVDMCDGETEADIQKAMCDYLNKETKDKLLALAVSWEETGKSSISNRIRTTMNFCAQELKDFIQNENA